MTANILDFFKKAGSVLYDDPTVQAYCAALQTAYFDTQTGLYKENQKALVYDFDAIADRILAGDRTLLDDLVCYYKCNDNTNNTKVVDIVNAHNGTASANTRTISTSSGAVDRGFLLDSTNPDYITISKSLPGSLTLDIDEAWTIRIIVKPSSLASTRTILSTMSVLTKRGILLMASATTGILSLRLYDTATNSWTINSSSGAVSTTAFTEIVLTNDGSGASTGLSMAVNTVDQGAATAAGTVSSIDNGDLTIGRDLNGTSPNDFDGIVDEFSIWKAELTSTQISSLYNSGNFSTYTYSVILDYLAWQFRVYLWDKSKDPATKLNILKQSLNFRGKIGTPWAIKQAIELVSDPAQSDFVTFPIVITEGTGGAFYNGAYDFDGSINFDSDYSPFKFDVDIPQATTPSAADQAIFLKAINSYKNARSLLYDLTYSPHTNFFGGNIELATAITNGAYFALEDNAANTTVVDSTGNFSGTASSNTSVFHNVSGFFDSCFDFSGGVTDNFTCDLESGTPGSVLAHSLPWFFSFWFYNPGTTGFKGMIGNVVAASYPGFYIYLNGTGNLNIIIRQGASQYRQAYNSNLVAGWNFAIVGQDATNTAAGTFCILNGTATTSQTQSGASLTDITSTNHVMFGDTLNLGGYTERMDEIGFFPVASTTTMESALWNSGAGLGY